MSTTLCRYLAHCHLAHLLPGALAAPTMLHHLHASPCAPCAFDQQAAGTWHAAVLRTYFPLVLAVPSMLHHLTHLHVPRVPLTDTAAGTWHAAVLRTCSWRRAHGTRDGASSSRISRAEGYLFNRGCDWLRESDCCLKLVLGGVRNLSRCVAA